MSHLHHKVSALVDGELSPAARSRALAHARACQQCRREIAETLELKRRLHKLAPVELSEDLLHVVAFVAPARPAAPECGRSPLLRRGLVGAGSLSAVVIVLAYVVGAPVPTPPRQVTPSVEEFAAEFADSTGLAPLSDPPVGATSAVAGAPGGVMAPIGLRDAGDPWAQEASLSAPTRYDDSAAEPDSERAAVQLLRRAVTAPQRIAFQGLRVVRAVMAGGVRQSSVRIKHNPGQGTTFDVRTESSTPTRWFVSDADAARGGADDRAAHRLADAYDLHMDGVENVDGRPAHVVSASHGGDLSARFWIDDATGLLLRKTMYVDGQLVRWSGFTSIDTHKPTFMPHLPPEVKVAPKTPVSTSTAPALSDKGWPCPELLATSFRLLALNEVDTEGGVMNAEYSDGMSTVSVFEETGTLDVDALEGFEARTVAGGIVYVRSGLPMTAVWQAGDRVLTMVTDAPEQVVDSVLDELPHGDTSVASADGPMARVGHGLTRMASAVTP